METTTYFGIDFKSRSQCERLHKKYRQEKYIGKGAYGKVYEVCIKEDCKYVLKVITFDNSIYEMSGVDQLSFENINMKWQQELDMHIAMEECQKSFPERFTPHLYDSWFCIEKNKDSHFYMVMEKFEGNLYQFIDKFKRNSTSVQTAIKSLIQSTLVFKLRFALEHVHNNCLICINDIKLDNVLYKEENGTYLFVFADFGLSSQFAEEKCKQEDKKRFELMISKLLEELNL